MTILRAARDTSRGRRKYRAGRDAATAIVRYLDRSEDARPDPAPRHGIG